MNYLVNIKDYSEPFQFDIITQIIIDTQRNKAKIKREWNKIIKFFETFSNDASDYSTDSQSNMKDMKLKEEYILDSHLKIHKQVLKNIDINKDIKEQHSLIPIFYYVNKPELKKQWKREHVEFGEVDSNGVINTGSTIVLYMLRLNWKIYMLNYNSINN